MRSRTTAPAKGTKSRDRSGKPARTPKEPQREKRRSTKPTAQETFAAAMTPALPVLSASGDVAAAVRASLAKTAELLRQTTALGAEWDSDKRSVWWSSVEQTLTEARAAVVGFSGTTADKIREEAEKIRRDLWTIRESFAPSTAPKVRYRSAAARRIFDGVRALHAQGLNGMPCVDTSEGASVLAVFFALERIVRVLGDYDRTARAGHRVKIKMSCGALRMEAMPDGGAS